MVSSYSKYTCSRLNFGTMILVSGKWIISKILLKLIDLALLPIGDIWYGDLILNSGILLEFLL